MPDEFRFTSFAPTISQAPDPDSVKSRPDIAKLQARHADILAKRDALIKKRKDQHKKGKKSQKKALEPVVETFTSVPAPPSIAELARALKHNVDLIYEWVYSNVDFSLMWGVHKGALGTLIDRVGGSLEQASLMVALLRESGYTADFAYGALRLSKADADQFLGTTGTTDETIYSTLFAYGGEIWNDPTYDGGVLDYIDFDHVWVQVDIGGTNYVFDPSYKNYTYTSGIDVGSVIDFDEGALIDDAESGATVTADYIEDLNQANINADFAQYGNELLDWIRTNAFDASMQDVIGGRSIQPLSSTPVRQTELPNQSPDWEPAFYSSIDFWNCYYWVSVNDTDFPWAFYPFATPDIYGKRLTVTFNGSMEPEIRLDGSLYWSGGAIDPDIFVGLFTYMEHPFGGYANQALSQGIFTDPDSIYVIGTAFMPTSQAMVDYHRGILQQNLADGGGASDENVLGESLSVLWFMYNSQNSLSFKILDQLANTTRFIYHFVGIAAYASHRKAPYFSVYGARTEVKNLIGDTSVEPKVKSAGEFPANGFEASILQQSYPVTGVNTQRFLEVANAGGQKLFNATSSNWYGTGGVREQLVNWDHDDLLETLDASIDNSHRLVIHEDGLTTIDDFVGSGWVDNIGDGYGGLITGGISGGASAMEVSKAESNTGAKNGPNGTTAGKGGPGGEQTSRDPVGLFSGNCYYDRTDLSVGSSSYPYALGFSRNYNSATRFVDGPLGLGWTHNLATNLAQGSNGLRGYGEVSPKEAAAAIALSYVLIQLDLASDGTLTKVLIAEFATLWLMDLITNNAITINDVAQSRSFVKLVDGSYNPPPGYADTIIDNLDGTFTFKNPQQHEWNFNTAGNLDTYVDPAGVTVSYTYDGSNRVETVSNGMDRTLTLTYSGARLESVSDGNGRSVAFTIDGNSNLTEFTDAESKTILYEYDNPGLLSRIFLPENPEDAVMENLYDSLGRVMSQSGSNTGTSEYFFAGSRAEEVDPLGNRHIMYYNSLGSLMRDINALEQETIFERDGLNRQIKVTYPEENSTEWEYDEKNNVLSITSIPKPGSPLSNIEQIWTFDSTWNKPDSFTDGNGNTTTFEYDPTQGTLMTITRPEVDSETPIVEFTYNARGQVLTRTDETGIIDSFDYDATNETLSSVTHDDGGLDLVTAYGYDVVGNVDSVTDPNGNETTFEFDNERRMTLQTDPAPLGYVTIWEYNDNGWRTSLQRETGDVGNPYQIWTWEYQINGSVESIIDPANNATTFEYDTNNRLTKRTDAEGRAWQYEYDEIGRISTVTDPQNVISETRAYTDNGMLESIEDANDNVTEYEYDGFDRLDKRIYPDATFEQNEVYDDNGNVLTFVTRNDEDIISTFDPLNRLKTRTPGSLPEQAMTYDLAGRLKNINTPFDAGDPTTGDYGFDYDSAGRLNEQSMPDTKTVLYDLDDNGNRIKLTYPDGYYVQYFYDEINRLTDIKLNGSGTAAIHFDYDPLSRRTATVYENGCDCAYGYELNDDLGNLDHTLVGSSVAFGFDYNKVHQVIGVSVDDEAYMWVPSAPSVVNYDPANNLNQYPEVDSTAFSYNPNGCLTGGLLTSAAFDVLNRLTQAVKGGVTNDYWNDPLNRQGQKAIDSVKTGYLYDGQQLIEEYDDNGDLAYRYIRGNRLDEIFIKIAGATKTYFHHDRLGSVIAVTDDGGAVLSNYVYSPFGETSSLSGTPFGFTGQRYDEEMGLYNYKARYYSPAIGRFLQPDPAGYGAGGMNLYSYVGNNASNLTDPMGLQAVCGSNVNRLDLVEDLDWLVKNLQKQAENFATWMNAWADAWGKAFVWFAGQELKDVYDEDSVEVQYLRNDEGVKQAMDLYRKKNAGKPLNMWESATDVDYNWEEHPERFFKAGVNPVLHYLGSYTVDIYPQGITGRAKIVVRDPKHIQSLTAQQSIPGLPSSDTGAWHTGIMRTQVQRYIWYQYP